MDCQKKYISLHYKTNTFRIDVIIIKQMETLRTIPTWKYDELHIEHWQTPENDLYQTREELEAAMPDNINWTLWDELVEQTKKQILEMPEPQEEEKTPETRHVWCYNTNGKLIGEFNSVEQAANKLDIPKTSVYQSIWRQRPYHKRQLYFSYNKLSVAELEKVKTMKAKKLIDEQDNSRTVEKWVYNLRGELLGHYESSDEVAKTFNIERGAVNYYAWKQEPYYKKNILILSHPIQQDTE